MTDFVAIRLAPPLDSYPPLTRRGEDLRSRPCVCGSDVVLLAGDAVGAAVDRHNNSVMHRTWREAQA